MYVEQDRQHDRLQTEVQQLAMAVALSSPRRWQIWKIVVRAQALSEVRRLVSEHTGVAS
ncbi:hypothetical protein ITP53_03990 [Nonomuraea sp. K274]|uniref:Uncharacterized protein n=1 Tax=Nonomuraea cypriaca TaxID=1187855 RepID=A0A931EWX6_9ACTN|nr:hypothetical protein [Nonomuraea cypriaca]MBF8184912.1 hypothetical protein [Nonomuraea cypriaca]